MQFGPMRKRITIQQNKPTRNTSGDPVPSWSTYATVWAAMQPLNGRELLAAQQIQSEVTTRIMIRYYAGVTPTMRVLYNGRYFDILAVVNVEERNRMMQLQCVERVGEQ